MDNHSSIGPNSFLGSLVEWIIIGVSLATLGFSLAYLVQDRSKYVLFQEGFSEAMNDYQEKLKNPSAIEVFTTLRFGLEDCAQYSEIAWSKNENNSGPKVFKRARVAGKASFEGCLAKSVENMEYALDPQVREDMLSILSCLKDCSLPSIPGLGPWSG